MADKDFDFDTIGKQMPYRTPDAFFEKMQEQVMEQVRGKQRRKMLPYMKLAMASAFAAAAMLLGAVFFPVTQPDAELLPHDSWIVSTDLEYSGSDEMGRYIENLSDEELEEWIELSDNDIFMN